MFCLNTRFREVAELKAILSKLHTDPMGQPVFSDSVEIPSRPQLFKGRITLSSG